jgi:hypothetical protein
MLIWLWKTLAATTLDDIAIGVFSSVDCFDSRILPMAQSWYQLVPRVDIYIERNLSVEMVTLLNECRHGNLHFHIQRHQPHALYGTPCETSWEWAQYRHLHAIADFYERHPNKSFYFICDDDTFAIPQNLLQLASSIDPLELLITGRVFMSAAFVAPFSLVTGPIFTHGGSGQLIHRALIKQLAPHLKKCADLFLLPFAGSDVRLGLCIERSFVNRSIPDQYSIHVRAFSFNSNTPWVETQYLALGPQCTFHHVDSATAPLMFGALVTSVDADSYFDWSPVAFSLRHFEVGGVGREMDAIFGALVITERPNGMNMKALGGIEKCELPFADFMQVYENNFELFIKCNPEMNATEIAYFAEPPSPHFGTILELKCPELSRFAKATESVVREVTCEEGSDL